MSRHQHNEPVPLKRPDEIDDVFGRANPNPERIGCPPHDVLVALAHKQRPIGDRAYDHLAECSPCYLEVRGLREAIDLRRRRLLIWSAAAVLVLAAGSVTWLSVNRESDIRGSATLLHAQFDLRPYGVTRGESQQSALPPLLLPRGRVSLTLLLPTASEPGSYEVQIRDSGAVPKVSARGEADLRNQVTALTVAVDVGSLSPGAYRLGVRRSGEDWQLFPVQLQ